MVEIASGRDESLTKILFDTAAKCLKQVGEEETKRLVNELGSIVRKNKEAGDALIEWLKLVAENGRLREVLGSDIVGKIGKLEEDRLEDIGKAWELNGRIDDFNRLMKGIETALELGEQRRENIFTLLHGFVETGDRDRVSFFERELGWMHDAAEMIANRGPRKDFRDAVIEFTGKILESGLSGKRMLKIAGYLTTC